MMQFKVEGMSCGHCVAAVTQAIAELDPQAQVKIDLAQGLVQVASRLSEVQVMAVIAEQGYSVGLA